jgi:hypothetical protein
MAISNSKIFPTASVRRSPQSRFQIAQLVLPAYSNCLMGQQHRVKVKRQRRKAYLERKRTVARAPRRPATKARSKKAAAPAPKNVPPAEEAG